LYDVTPTRSVVVSSCFTRGNIIVIIPVEAQELGDNSQDYPWILPKTHDSRDSREKGFTDKDSLSVKID
jgi:hypothetical protein